MTITRIGMVTIGQSPRKDVVPEIRQIVGNDVDIVERGALDGLSKDEIKSLAPTSDDHVLVTVVRNGEPVIVGESRILPRLKDCVHELTNQCDLIALLCTERFQQLTSRRIMLVPDVLVKGLVDGILGVGTLGVLTPSIDQKDQAFEKWRSPGRKVVVESASPYSEKDEITASAKKLTAFHPDLVVLDCIGYRFKARRKVENITGKPTILPRSIIAHTILELTGAREK